jgi:16S rRNA (adenine1518-N6/adenine1519-N6)-dimethyltransferase
VRAKRSLGQNFLVDPNLQRKIVRAVDPGPGDTVVEIGPGRGALTEHLALSGARLVAIELDDDLAPDLDARYRNHPDVAIVHGDALDWDPATLHYPAALKVVGNIPYNITSPLLFRLLDWRPAPELIVLMVQKEVADRIMAGTGEKAYGALTVGVRARADVERLFTVGRQAFRPVPGVDSAVIRIRPRPGEAGDPAAGATKAGYPEAGDLAADHPLRDLTRAAFGMRRKQLQKILRTAPGYGLDAATTDRVLGELDLRPEDRPETLDPATFVALAAALGRLGYPR